MMDRTSPKTKAEKNLKTQVVPGVGVAPFEEAYEKLLSERPGMLASEAGGELAWLKEARERDSIRWRAEGLPTRGQEEWMYTSVAAIAESKIVLPSQLKDLPSRDRFPALAGEVAAEVVFLNGHFVASWSKTASGSGVSVMVLSKLFEDCVENGWSAERLHKFAEFRSHIATSDADRETVFSAMNTSFLEDAVLIHVDKNVRIEKPIVAYYLSDASEPHAQGELVMASPRVFMTLDLRAEASLIEVYAGVEQARYFTNAVSDLRVAEGARLSYSKVQIEGGEGFHLGTTRIRQQRDSWTESFQFSFGAKLSRQDLHVSLEGEGAEAVVDGLYMVRGRQHVDNHTSIEHVVPHTTSAQIYKGILDDESRAVFNGRVKIYRDAQKSNSSQLNNNLVLSAKAEVDTKPELEIDADDVKAAHGATIGQMDPEHLFYLQARAIPREEGVRMLARGFAQEVVYRIQNESMRTRLLDVVSDRFDQMQILAAKIDEGGSIQ